MAKKVDDPIVEKDDDIITYEGKHAYEIKMKKKMNASRLFKILINNIKKSHAYNIINN